MVKLSVSLLIAALAFSSLGCGTFLWIGQTSPESDPAGVAVNRRATFKLKIQSPYKGQELKYPREKTVTGVDPRSVVTVDIRRMPFASGKLVVKLNPEQLLQQVDIESDTGAVRAAQAADKALDTQAKLEAAE